MAVRWLQREMTRFIAIGVIWVLGVCGIWGQKAPAVETYVGAYRTPSGQVIRMVVQRNRLVRHDAAGNISFEHESDDVFVGGTTKQRVQFVRGKTGDVTHLIMADEKAIRVVIAPDLLPKYVGYYPLSADFGMTITLEGGQLIAQATGQSKHPLIPESATTFFVHDSNSTNSHDVAQLEFGAEPQPFVIFRQSGGEQKVLRK